MNTLSLSPEQRRQIEDLLSVPTMNPSNALQRRAKAILLYDQGKGTREVALEAGLSRGRARYWRRQFIARGMSIFYAIENASSETEPGSSPVIDPQSNPFSSLDLVSAGDPVLDPGSNPLLETAFEAALGDHSSDISFPEPMPQVGMQAGDIMAEAGRKIMLFYFAEMLSHETGTCQGVDIEELHDMRVATRRLRAAFDVFGDAFTPKVVQRHLKGLRLTGRALGHVRDLDVFIEKTQHSLENLPPTVTEGLKPLLNQWEQERQAARAVMLEHLTSEAYHDFKVKFNLFVQTPGKGARRSPEDELAPDRVCEIAPVLIYTRLASVRAFEPVLHSANLDQLHALRIECKKLRYAVEFFREVLGGEAKRVIGSLKEIQDHLGDLNDARVACGLLNDFLANWEARQANLPLAERQSPEPIAAYLAARHAELHRLMVTFPDAWLKFNSPEFHKNLALAVAAL